MKRPLTRRDFVMYSTAAAGTLSLPSSLIARDAARTGHSAALDARMRPVNYADVTITDSFWRPKMEKVATTTLQACIYQTEEKTARIRNFEKAARRKGEPHEGLYYDDSDVYKALEAIAYALKVRPNAELERKADEWIDKIAAAQELDGYLNTFFTLTGLQNRWTDMSKHEDYCAGHLIEAGIAYYQATEKRKLLDVSVRFADHLDSTFRVPNRHWVTGHQEIELALMKLYHLTGEHRYLKLAEWYLDQRGHGYGKGKLWEAGEDLGYCQDAAPVRDQREITGHAVRAMYLYSGVVDVTAVTHDQRYMSAMNSIWDDLVCRNMYVTGGIGSKGSNEGFSHDYALSNAHAYCETCASVGMVFWNQRMNLMTGNSQYMDVLERSLYNGALDGLSLSGDRFFYANRLASGAKYPGLRRDERQEWFGTACCPSNIARLIASLGGYVYGTNEHGLWVNLFVANSASVKVGDSSVALRMETGYPWDGEVKLTVEPVRRIRFALHVRVPGWARNVAAPGDLYRFAGADRSKIKVLMNGKPIRYRLSDGYAVIDREWRKGDIVELTLPMPIRKVVARQEVKANRDRYALQRGPIVYCVEGADNGDMVWNFVAPQDEEFSELPYQVLSESVVAIRGTVKIPTATGGDSTEGETKTVTAIPYYTWANRGNYEMQVWMPTTAAVRGADSPAGLS